jgi:hypothetical protein
LDVQASGETLVNLTLGIRVEGGWLSRFELAGLEPGIVLDPDKPPWLLCDDGRKVAPQVRLRDDGRIVLTFPDKKEAPHRGHHRLGLAYYTTLAPGEATSGKRVTASWSMPAWQVDLREAEIWVSAPAGVELAAEAAADADAAVARERLARGSRTILHLHRAQLPRTVAFAVQLEMPSAGPLAMQPRRTAPASGSGGARAALWAAMLVLGLAWLKGRATRGTGLRRRAVPMPLIALGPVARPWLMSALALAGGVSYPDRPSLGLTLLACTVTLALDRKFVRRTVAEQESTSPPPRAQRVQELFSTSSWLDATTPPGFSLLCSAYTVAVLRLALGAGPGLWLETLLLVTPLWVTGTRLHAIALRSAGPAAERAGSPEARSSADVGAVPGSPAHDRAA